jgi:hypothetical protein
MTEDEWGYVEAVVQKHMDEINQRFEIIKDKQRSKDCKQSKINQDKERQRLMSVYYKGENK